MSVTFEFDGIGTHWWCELLDRTSTDERLVAAVKSYVDVFDKSYSRFISSSLVGCLNSGETIKNPPQELYDMLTYAKQLFDDSDGAFNITVGGDLHAKGYGSREQAARIWYEPWSHITLSPEQIGLPNGMTIDLGGFGKGWLIDKLGELFETQGYSHYLINGGGDMLIRSEEPITIQLEDPRDDTQAFGEIQITQGALAGSANTKRSWQYEGKTYHHIIDPLGKKNDVVGTFVTAESALIADSLATIIFLRPELQSTLETDYHATALLIKN